MVRFFRRAYGVILQVQMKKRFPLDASIKAGGGGGGVGGGRSQTVSLYSAYWC